MRKEQVFAFFFRIRYNKGQEKQIRPFPIPLPATMETS